MHGLEDHCQGTLSPEPAAAWGLGAGEKVPVGLKSSQEHAFLGGSGTLESDTCNNVSSGRHLYKSCA